MTRWGEIKCQRCAELEAQITAMEEGLTAVHMAGYMDGQKAAEAKLAQQDDLVQAAVAAALREAAELNGWWLGVNFAGEPDGTFCSVPPHEDEQAEKYVRASRILALITPDAQAALDRYVKQIIRSERSE